MGAITKIFNGRLNLDDAALFVAKGDFISALNITRDQISGQQDLVCSNIKSNRFVPYNLPGGTNKVIGAKSDALRNCVYYFIFNSALYHTIARYNNDDRTIDTVFQNVTDTGNLNIFDLYENRKINHIDIIHRDEGDLLYWTDGFTSPKKINVTKALNGEYAPASALDIEAAKAPPLFPAGALYISDSNIVVNNVNKNLFEFAYRNIYHDFEKSTFSPLSVSPLRQYDYLTALNPLSNNAITVTVNTGGKEITKIEVVMRQNQGNVYSDYYLINTISKSALGLADNLEYSFNFSNDAAYPVIDVREATELFDYVPRRANAQILVNGNYLVYGGILEGYANLTRDQMNVITTVTYDEIGLPEGVIVIGNPSFTYTTVLAPGGSVIQLNLQVGPTVTPGDKYALSFTIQRIPFTTGCPISGEASYSFNYTAILGDTQVSVANYFIAQITGKPRIDVNDFGGGSFHLQTNPSTCFIFVNVSISTTAATASATGDFFDRIYKFGGKYRFGIVYFDEQGRTPGVQTYITQPGNTNDFEVDIAEFSAAVSAYKRPVINLTVAHLPPSWAKSFSFVRTKNLVTTSFFMWKIDDFQDDGSFFYFGIDNLQTFETNTPNFTSAWTFQTGDRIKAVYQFNGLNPTGWNATYSPVLDFEIIGQVEYNPGSGAKTYIKARKYPGTITPAYTDNLVFEVYRPSLKTTASNLLYYEFGETFECVVIDGVNYHQFQNASVNPTFYFRDGDSYIRMRPGIGDEYLVLDPNFSDYTVSAVDSDGRAFIEDQNAAETYNPVLVRFSQAYQFGTNINGLNRFYFENFDEYARNYGDIFKLDYFGSYMKVGQKFRIGNVPVQLQIINTADGNGSLTSVDQLLGTIVYYAGDYGIGNSPESWARNNFAVYFCDTIRGVVCRLSQDGITPISILYKVNSWATEKLPLRTNDYKIYGVFNAQVNRYEFAMEAVAVNPLCHRYQVSAIIDSHADYSYLDCNGEPQSGHVDWPGTATFCALGNTVTVTPLVGILTLLGNTCPLGVTTDPPFTMVFDEQNNAFEGERSYQPEMMTCLGTLFVTFKNGQLWTHDDNTFNNFYGVQYESNVTGVFNESPLEKKTFMGISEVANVIWDCPQITTNIPSTNTVQQSALITQDFTTIEGNQETTFLRDINSIGGLINGDSLKGIYMIIKFRAQENITSNFVYLGLLNMRIIESPLNNR